MTFKVSQLVVAASRRAALAAATALALWIAGLFLFAAHIQSLTEPLIDDRLEKTDAIVVPTGGSERVSTGVALLQAHAAEKLFISGVYQGVSPRHVLNSPIPDDLRECCITLGYNAESTTGNAEETREWVESRHYKSLRLVTANYHMPRSLMAFHHAMPDVTIIPHSVTPDTIKLDQWWKHSGTAILLVSEYTKSIILFTRMHLGLL